MAILHMMQGASAGGVKAPAGLIIPYTTTGTPSGWADFSAADGMNIIGAGSTYSADETGGGATTAISGTSTTDGSHGPGSESGGQPGGNIAETSAGAHSHNFSISASTQDVYKDFRLLKASADAKMPAYGVLLAATSLADLTNVETTTNALLRANSTYGGTGGSASISGSGSTSGAGSHIHSGSEAGYWGGDMQKPRYESNTGSHSHNMSVSGTLNTKRKLLSAWTNAASEFDVVANGIAMWQSATPPSGWAICDGTNGTPDMRDFFLHIGNTGNHGTSSGDNQASWSSTIDTSNASHNHNNGNLYSYYHKNASHASYTWSHSHNASGTQTILQPYYGLYFVQYLG
jgi:hypothetical protein